MRKRKRHTVGGIIGIILAGCIALAGLVFLGTLLKRMYDITTQEGHTITEVFVPEGMQAVIPNAQEETPEETPTPEEEEPEVTPTPEPSNEPQTVGAQKQDVQVLFPREMANRAAITGLENYFAIDIYDAKGEIDLNKVHTYSDTTGEINQYLIYDKDNGIWTGKSEDQWHVEALELDFASGKKMTVSLTVRYDKDNDIYVLSDLKDMNDDPSTHVNFLSASTFYYVYSSMISEDRWSE